MAAVTGLGVLGEDALGAPKVVITMPAYKAEATLARTIADIPPGVADQLILVDDASPDNTAELARELGVDVHVHAENRGYGENQKTCYTMALAQDADIVVMLHPDYQYEPKAVPLLIAPILAGEADMTFGSRFAGLGDPRAGGMPLYRYVGNRVTTIAENLLLGSRFTEMHSGMRAYTRRCLLSLPFLQYSEDFVFDSQLLIDAVIGGQRVIEVPIPTRYTDESSSIGTFRSLSYVGRSLGYCVSRVTAHGRKRRSPIGRRAARGKSPATGGPAGNRPCALCGAARPHFETAAPSGIRCGMCGLLTPSTYSPQQADDGLRARATGGNLRDWMLAELRGYAFTGERLLEVVATRAILNTSANQEPGERELSIEAATNDDARVCAVLLPVTSEPTSRALGGLVGLRRLLDPEGMLAVLVPLSRSSRRSHDAWPIGVQADTIERALREAGFRLVALRQVPRRLAGEHAQLLAALGPGSRPTKPMLVLARADGRATEP